ncbi:hypothetical protein PS710_03117 [Pseudomonas fluorescens]|jgi:hypothetical protein|uniref:Uncharacterized protein n=1 Tax=Pseudomonas fluorescens TaxID=294 RepID=A0A5E6VD47_PSEFL|nr:hypothetical protein PS639_04002 [Pseudomonas fluorescens]VVO06724.1 hypothetical protein PS710_03117 [Pseudomonas fluorescens]
MNTSLRIAAFTTVAAATQWRFLGSMNSYNAFLTTSDFIPCR